MEAYTDEQLEAELARRRALSGQQKVPIPPAPALLANPDWQPLIGLVLDYIVHWESGGYQDDNDFDAEVSEAALGCLFGPAIWEWLKVVMV